MSEMTENPSDAKPKSKEPFSVASTERLSNVPRSAVRPDAPKSPASKDARSPETSARHGAKVQDICPERQDSAGRPSDALDKIQERWEKIVKDRDFDTYVGCNCERCKPTWDKMFSEIREVLVIDRIAMKCAGDMINEKTKELALKSKRIAELEAENTQLRKEVDGEIDRGERFIKLGDERAKIKTEQAHSQGGNEAIAEMIEVLAPIDVIWKFGIVEKLESMKKEVGKT